MNLQMKMYSCDLFNGSHYPPRLTHAHPCPTLLNFNSSRIGAPENPDLECILMLIVMELNLILM